MLKKKFDFVAKLISYGITDEYKSLKRPKGKHP